MGQLCIRSIFPKYIFRFSFLCDKLLVADKKYFTIMESIRSDLYEEILGTDVATFATDKIEQPVLNTNDESSLLENEAKPVLDLEVTTDTMNTFDQPMLEGNFLSTPNHGNFDVSCELCNEPMSVADLREHILQVHVSGTHLCDMCRQVFDSKEDLSEHMEAAHTGNTCNTCNKTFSTKQHLRIHIHDEHLGKTKRCPDCQKNLPLANFYRHIKEVHRKQRKPCPHCDKHFPMSNLSHHIRAVHEVETKSCPHCGKEVSVSNFVTHIKRKHNIYELNCEICGLEVKLSVYSDHKRKVHGVGGTRGLRKEYKDITKSENNSTTVEHVLKFSNNFKTEFESEVNKLRNIQENPSLEREVTLEEEESRQEDKILTVGGVTFSFSYA